MRISSRLAPLFLLTLFGMTAPLLADFEKFRALPVAPELADALQRTAAAVQRDFPKLAADDLALSVIDLTPPDAPRRADYQGDAPFYPASVIKLFVMVEIFRQGKHTPEIDRALREMIRVSDNDATAYLIDVLSDTTAGPELTGKALEDFTERRGVLNRTFQSLGYEISALMKPWSFGPYGREMQLLGEKREHRNRVTANACAALLYWIVRCEAVSPAAATAMLDLLARPLDPPRPEENQVQEFLGESLPPGAKLWSKAGDTSEVRHDAAYFELPDGRKLILVALTRAGAEKALLPALGKRFLAELGLSESYHSGASAPF